MSLPEAISPYLPPHLHPAGHRPRGTRDQKCYSHLSPPALGRAHVHSGIDQKSYPCHRLVPCPLSVPTTQICHPCRSSESIPLPGSPSPCPSLTLRDVLSTTQPQGHLLPTLCHQSPHISPIPQGPLSTRLLTLALILPDSLLWHQTTGSVRNLEEDFYGPWR